MIPLWLCVTQSKLFEHLRKFSWVWCRFVLDLKLSRISNDVLPSVLTIKMFSLAFTTSDSCCLLSQRCYLWNTWCIFAREKYPLQSSMTIKVLYWHDFFQPWWNIKETSGSSIYRDNFVMSPGLRWRTMAAWRVRGPSLEATKCCGLLSSYWMFTNQTRCQ